MRHFKLKERGEFVAWLFTPGKDVCTVPAGMVARGVGLKGNLFIIRPGEMSEILMQKGKLVIYSKGYKDRWTQKSPNTVLMRAEGEIAHSGRFLARKVVPSNEYSPMQYVGISVVRAWATTSFLEALAAVGESILEESRASTGEG